MFINEYIFVSFSSFAAAFVLIRLSARPIESAMAGNEGFERSLFSPYYFHLSHFPYFVRIIRSARCSFRIRNNLHSFPSPHCVQLHSFRATFSIHSLRFRRRKPKRRRRTAKKKTGSQRRNGFHFLLFIAGPRTIKENHSRRNAADGSAVDGDEICRKSRGGGPLLPLWERFGRTERRKAAEPLMKIAFNYVFVTAAAAELFDFSRRIAIKFIWRHLPLRVCGKTANLLPNTLPPALNFPDSVRHF